MSLADWWITIQLCRKKSICRLKKFILAAREMWLFLPKVRTNCDPANPYSKSLIYVVCSVYTCIGKYCFMMFFLYHRTHAVYMKNLKQKLC